MGRYFFQHFNIILQGRRQGRSFSDPLRIHYSEVLYFLVGWFKVLSSVLERNEAMSLDVGNYSKNEVSQ